MSLATRREASGLARPRPASNFQRCALLLRKRLRKVSKKIYTNELINRILPGSRGRSTPSRVTIQALGTSSRESGSGGGLGGPATRPAVCEPSGLATTLPIPSPQGIAPTRPQPPAAPRAASATQRSSPSRSPVAPAPPSHHSRARYPRVDIPPPRWSLAVVRSRSSQAPSLDSGSRTRSASANRSPAHGERRTRMRAGRSAPAPPPSKPAARGVEGSS
jgi:hypothetical protein